MSDQKIRDTNNLRTAPAADPNGSGSASSDGGGGSDTDNRYPPLLERRLRDETTGFEFGSLLGGVSTLDRETVAVPAPAPVETVATVAPVAPVADIPAPQSAGKSPQPSPALFIGVGAVAAAAGLAAAVGLMALFQPQMPTLPTVTTLTSKTSAASAPRSPRPAAPVSAAPTTAAAEIEATTLDRSTLRANVSKPDPALTPGRLQLTPRFEAPIPDATRLKVLHAYGVDASDKRYIVCRLIPGSLGGTEDAENLFPTTAGFADRKLRLDNDLAQRVAGKKLTADEARAELTTDWITSAHKRLDSN